MCAKASLTGFDRHKHSDDGGNGTRRTNRREDKRPGALEELPAVTSSTPYTIWHGLIQSMDFLGRGEGCRHRECRLVHRQFGEQARLYSKDFDFVALNGLQQTSGLPRAAAA